MERKEFNTIDEAIEALNDIANIDYSRNVDEIAERQFYSRLMNNFMGIKNINLTKEDKEKYKAALSKKGLLKYSEWKSMQPKNDEQVTWKNSVEKGSLDAPVNLFSKLLEADYDKKFDYIKDVVSNEEKSNIGKAWLEKNSEILEDLEKSRINDNADRILAESEKDLSSFVNEILSEKEESKKEQDPVNTENENKINKEEQKSVKFADKFGAFETPEEAIEALKNIDRIEYKKGKEPDKLEEKNFYNDIMKNLMASSKLKFSDDQAYKYKKALESIGCKQRGRLNKLRKIDEDIEVPVDIVSSILQSTRGDHYQNLKAQKSKVRTDENVKKWVETTDEVISVKDYEGKLEKELDNILENEDINIEEQEETRNLPVPAKKPGFFKKLGTHVKFGIAGLAALVGVTGFKSNDKEVKEDMSKSVASDVIKDTVKTGLNRDAQNPLTVKAEIPDLDNFTIELQSNVNNGYRSRVIDQAYTKTPDNHDAITSAGNAKAFEQVAKDNADEIAATKAKEEVAENDINNRYEKDEDTKEKDENINEDVTFVVEDDGSGNILTDGDSKPVEDDREIVDMGVIAFDTYEAYENDDDFVSFVDYEEESNEEKEENLEDKEKQSDEDERSI